GLLFPPDRSAGTETLGGTLSLRQPARQQDGPQGSPGPQRPKRAALQLVHAVEMPDDEPGRIVRAERKDAISIDAGLRESLDPQSHGPKLRRDLGHQPFVGGREAGSVAGRPRHDRLHSPAERAPKRIASAQEAASFPSAVAAIAAPTESTPKDANYSPVRPKTALSEPLT